MPLHLSRRTFLRGLGTAVALPFLDIMRDAPQARAQTTLADGTTFADGLPRRFFAFYVPNGFNLATLVPSSEGSDYVMPEALDVLSPFRDELLLLSNLENFPATAQQDGAGDHARGTAAFLTATHPNKTPGADVRNNISLDQIFANAWRGQTKLPSIEMGCENGQGSGSCDSGYSCIYNRNIAWANSTTPLAKEINPVQVFNRLFAGDDFKGTAEQIERRKRYKQSILDFVKDDTTRLNTKLGSKDKQKLDQYLTGLREVELRLQAPSVAEACQSTARPDGIPLDVTAYVRIMIDMAVLAFTCDITRVATFMIGDSTSNRNFAFLGIPQSHHEISHHQQNPDRLGQLTTIDKWELEQFGYLLGRLKEIPELDGSILDSTLTLMSSEIGDGNTHSHDNLPFLLGGSGGGAIRTGRHVRTRKEPVANLYLTLLNNMGVPANRFGDDGVGLVNFLG